MQDHQADTTPTTPSTAPAVPARPPYYSSTIALDAIARNPDQPRKHFDEAALAELAESIRALGVLQPVALRTAPDIVDPDTGEPCAFEIILGERRVRASRLAGRDSVPAMIYEATSRAEAAVLALTENLQREKLNPMEEAEGFAHLETIGLSHREIAERTGRARTSVTNALRLMGLPEDVREHIRAGRLTARHGTAILRFREWPAVMSKIAELALEEGTPTATLETGLPFVDKLRGAGLLVDVDDEILWGNGWEDEDIEASLEQLAALEWVHKFETQWGSEILVAFDREPLFAWLEQHRPEHMKDRPIGLDACADDDDAPGQERPPSTIAAADGSQLLDVRSLPYGTYKLLDELAVEIRRQIPEDKIETGVDRYAARRHPDRPPEPVKFTRDLDTVRRLERARTIRTNRASRARLDIAWESALFHVRAISAVESADLAVLAGWILDHHRTRDHIAAALDLLGLTVKRGKFEALEPVQIVKLVLTARLHEHYEDDKKNARANPHSDLARYAPDLKDRLAAAAREAKAAQVAAAKPAKKDKQGKANAQVAAPAAPPPAPVEDPPAVTSKGKRTISEALRFKIREAVQAGATYRNAAARFGVSVGAVAAIANASKIAAPAA